jgi:galactose-6-phosphate isomerase
MQIAIGCDHAGVQAKDYLVQYLVSKGHQVVDCGTYSNATTHYVIYGFEVARQVATKQVEIGIVICGTGIGITNAAQKTKGTRVCLARDIEVARKARELYNCNILGLGANVVGIGLMVAIVEAFVNNKYKGSNKTFIKAVDTRMAQSNYDIHQFDQEIAN